MGVLYLKINHCPNCKLPSVYCIIYLMNNDEYDFITGEDIDDKNNEENGVRGDSICPRCGLRTYEELCPSCGTAIVDKTDDEDEEYDWREKHR